MHAALTVAAFAVGALAVPYKRDVVYDYDVVYVTDVVTVTAGQPAAYQAAPSSAVVHVHHGHGGHHWRPSSSSVEVVSTVITSSYEAPLPTWTPEPETSTTSTTPVYTPPPTTSSSEPAYTPPAPTSTVEPVFLAPAPTSTPEPVFSAPAPSVSLEAPASSSAPASSDYQSTVLYHHNLHRANHSASDLTWNDELASLAEALASQCIFQHNLDMGSGGYGQNLAAGDAPDNAGDFISNMWYNDEMMNYNDLYNQAAPSMEDFGSWGHFSQIVWKATTSVGCATVACQNGVFNDQGGKIGLGDSNNYNTVCNYGSPGNAAGAYADNIGEPLGQAPVVFVKNAY